MNVPNTITLVRIFGTPLFILFFLLDSVWSIAICLGLLILFEISDFVDGHLARSLDQVTVFGKLMDPFADSISRFTVFLCFLSADLAPVWLVAIFFYRDIFVAIVRVFAMREDVVVSARISGKIKAWAQAIATISVVTMILAQKLALVPQPFFAFENILVSEVLVFIAAMVTLWSGIDYWNGNKHIILKSMQK